jgi:hypothetical protein
MTKLVEKHFWVITWIHRRLKLGTDASRIRKMRLKPNKNWEKEKLFL